MKGILKGFGWFLFYFLLMALVQQIFVICGSGGKNMQAMSLYMENHMLTISAASNFLVGLILFLSFYFRKTRINEEWRLLSFKKKDMIYAMILAFSYSLISSLLTRNQTLAVSKILNQSSDYYGAQLGFILKFINVLLFAPVVEEIALRGIVYTRIKKSASVWTAILISGILFGLMHFMAGGIALVISATIMGILMGFLLYRYDSLWICIAAHFSANLPTFLLGNIDNYPFIMIIILEVVSLIIALFCLIKIVRT